MNIARFLSILPLLLTWFAPHSLARAQAGVPWTSGGHITTGGGYDISTGTITREVVDFEVPGSVGTRPLRCARTLSVRPDYDTKTELPDGADSNNKIDTLLPMAPGSYWRFDNYYVAWGRAWVKVSYPSGRLIIFKGAYAQGVGDRLEFDEEGNASRLLLTDGSVVEFSPLPGDKNVRDANYRYGSRILDSHGIPTTVEPYNRSFPRRITDHSGRWISFEFENNEVSAVRSSAGQLVTYEHSGQIGAPEITITAAHYQDGSSASYRYSTNEACNYNLPLELRDVRATSKIQHIQYSWEKDVLRKCGLRSELSRSGVVVSSRLLAGPAVGMDFLEVLPSGRDRRYHVQGSYLLERTDAFGKLWKYQYDKRGFLSGVTDPYDRTTVIKNEEVAGQIVSIRYPDNTDPDKPPSVSYTYTDPQRPYFVRTKTDERGHTTTYHYHPAPHHGVVQRIDYPDRTWESWDELTPFAQPRVHTLRNGAKEYFEYDDMGRLKTRWNPTRETQDPRKTPALQNKVGRTKYTYYLDGHPWEDLLESETDPLGHTTRYEYARWPGESVVASALPTRPGDIAPGTPISGRPLRTKTIYHDGSNVIVKYNQFGQKISETNEEGEETTYEYDDDFNRMTAQKAPLGRTTRYDYTPVSDGIVPVASGPDARHSHTSSVPFTTISPEKNRSITAYDEEGRVLLTVEAAGTPDEASTRFGYDDVKRLIRKVDPEQRETTFEYDRRDRKTWERKPGGRATHWKYDLSGNIDTITYLLPNHPEVGDQTYTETESFKYDGMNNRTEHTDERGKPTIYKFEGGKLSRIFDPEKRQSGFEYDASGRVIQRLTPASDGIEPLVQESFHYDLAGNLIEHSDRRGVTESIEYGARNREKLRTYTDGTPSRATPLYDNVGRPRIRQTIAADPRDSTRIEYDYDDAGRVEKSRQKIGNHRTREITYGYNLDDQVRLMLLGERLTIERQYTKRGQLKYVSDKEGDVVEYAYYLDGQLREKKLYTDALSTYSYDPAGRLQAIEDNKLAGRRYRYDDRDRVVETRTDRGITETFAYFPDSQLKSYQRTGASGRASQDDTFVYDDSGNRLSSALHGTYVVDGTNQYRSVNGPASEQFGYDAVGNLTARNSWTYAYDAKWQMTRATAAESEAGFTYTYDAEGRLVGIRDPEGVGRHALYDGNNAIAWFDDDDDDRMIEASVWGRSDDEPLVTWRVENREGLVYHLDRQHSVVQLSDYNGKALEGFVYGAFGAPEVLPALQPFASLGPLLPPYLYTSQRWLQPLSLYHYRARTYDPNLGRFLQTDPAGIDAGDLNLYRYVQNSPTNYTDPTGNFLIPAIPALPLIVEIATPVLLRFAVLSAIADSLSDDATNEKGVEGEANHIQQVGTTNDAAGTAQQGAQEATQVDKPSAEDRAKSIHGALDERGQRARTTAVTETKEGTRVVSSSEPRLTPGQRDALQQGEVEGKGAGHAEVTGVNAAKDMGLTPIGVAASRPICPTCRTFLEAEGVSPLSPLKR